MFGDEEGEEGLLDDEEAELALLAQIHELQVRFRFLCWFRLQSVAVAVHTSRGSHLPAVTLVGLGGG